MLYFGIFINSSFVILEVIAYFVSFLIALNKYFETYCISLCYISTFVI